MSLAVAFGIGGVVLPSVANAAVPPVPTTVQLTVPTRLSNDGTKGTGTLTITTGNDTHGVSLIPDPGNTVAHIAITGPSGLLASDFTLTMTDSTYSNPYGPVSLSWNGSNFSGDVPINMADDTVGHVDNNYYTVKVKNPSVTGPLTTVVTLQHPDGNLAVSNTGTTALVAPEAPTFNAAPPAATIYQSYSYTLAPAVFPPADWTVYRKHTTNATPPVTTYKELTDIQPCGVTPQKCIVLGHNVNEPALLFNTTTRVISGTAADLNKALPNPDPLVFVANNGTGGATAAAVVNAEPDESVLPVKRHDVSMTATIPVLFSDVAFADTFGPAIYSLAGQMPNSVIQGYGDGTFRPNITVTRQAFVHFAAQVINNSGTYVGTGPCNTAFHPSAFSDVPNSSAFCKEIQDLSTLGVVNGYTDGTFGPTNIVSRQAISAFLYRVDLVVKNLNANTQGDAQCTGSAPFNDVAVTDQFCGDISWMVDNGMTVGYSDGGFHPLASSSRQATAWFLYKLEIFEGTVTP